MCGVRLWTHMSQRTCKDVANTHRAAERCFVYTSLRKFPRSCYQSVDQCFIMCCTVASFLFLFATFHSILFLSCLLFFPFVPSYSLSLLTLFSVFYFLILCSCPLLLLSFFHVFLLLPLRPLYFSTYFLPFSIHPFTSSSFLFLPLLLFYSPSLLLSALCVSP